MSSIRPATLQDLPGVYRVCLQTGATGQDATDLYRDPDLLGHIYAGPYVVGPPCLAFVVTDRQGVAGYVFAAEDTRAFEDWAERSWWPALRDHYPDSTGTDPDAELIRAIHQPQRASDAVTAEYPAHLHIDLLPRVQGKGYGRQLIERVLAVLRQKQIRGVHLVVGAENASAMAFYRRLGFHTLLVEQGAVHMGMRLP